MNIDNGAFEAGLNRVCNYFKTLDSNEFFNLFSSNTVSSFDNYPLLWAVGVEKHYTFSDISEIPDNFLKKDWHFCLFPFECNDDLYPLKKSDKYPIHIIIPKYVGTINKKGVFISLKGEKEIISNLNNENYDAKPIPKLRFEADLDLEEYKKKLKKVKKHLKRGDIYETNFCYNLKVKSKEEVNPIDVFYKLQKENPAPFSSLFNIPEVSIISSSPERFFCKKGNKIVSQPIKGTQKRNLENLKIDKKNAIKLQFSQKEITENTMIVDLARNDLSKIATVNSVKVEKLTEMKTFAHVHQLVSTISCKTKKHQPFSETLKSLYPAASMTGVPKKKCLELIEKYEKNSRKYYSGTIGYVCPKGNMDFSVNIRMFCQDKVEKTWTIGVGGAITFLSKIKKEYKETILKARPLLKIFDNSIT